MALAVRVFPLVYVLKRRVGLRGEGDIVMKCPFLVLSCGISKLGVIKV